MACDLLQGVDLDAVQGDAQAVRDPVHLPAARAGVPLSQLFPGFGVPLHARVRRCPPARANAHASSAPCSAQALVAAAIADFQQFSQAKLEGRLEPDLRYVLALPTPYTQSMAAPDAVPDVQALQQVEAQCIAALQQLWLTLPAEQMAVQWDMPAELRLWETRGRDLAAPRGLPERVLESCARVWAALPAAVQVGLHVCGGPHATAGAASSLGQAVRLVGAVVASTEREPTWLHFAVPADAVDSDWYSPLANLQLWPAMEVHLGVVHADCGATAAVNRLAAAQAVLPWAAASLACEADPVQALPVLQRL